MQSNRPKFQEESFGAYLHQPQLLHPNSSDSCYSCSVPALWVCCAEPRCYSAHRWEFWHRGNLRQLARQLGPQRLDWAGDVEAGLLRFQEQPCEADLGKV